MTVAAYLEMFVSRLPNDVAYRRIADRVKATADELGITPRKIDRVIEDRYGAIKPSPINAWPVPLITTVMTKCFPEYGLWEDELLLFCPQAFQAFTRNDARLGYSEGA